MEPVPDAVLAAILGLIGGTVLGLAAQIGRFCTIGAVEDALYAEDSRGLRMWALALGVAIAVTALGDAIGLPVYYEPIQDPETLGYTWTTFTRTWRSTRLRFRSTCSTSTSPTFWKELALDARSTSPSNRLEGKDERNKKTKTKLQTVGIKG